MHKAHTSEKVIVQLKAFYSQKTRRLDNEPHVMEDRI